jgi:hypothetical protein
MVIGMAGVENLDLAEFLGISNVPYPASLRWLHTLSTLARIILLFLTLFAPASAVSTGGGECECGRTGLEAALTVSLAAFCFLLGFFANFALRPIVCAPRYVLLKCSDM